MITSTINHAAAKTAAPFPKLMISKLTGYVYYVREDSSCLSMGNENKIFGSNVVVDLGHLIDFDGSITLRNGESNDD